MIMIMVTMLYGRPAGTFFRAALALLLIMVSIVCSSGAASADGAKAAAGFTGGRALISASKAAYRNPADIEAFFIKNKIPQQYLNPALNSSGEAKIMAATRTGLAVPHGVVYYRLDYTIPSGTGAGIVSSGILALPAGAWRRGEIKLVSYQHGTLFEDRNAPSKLDSCLEAQAVACVFASRGFAVAMADYRGLGRYSGFHPYFHAESIAIDCDAFLKAASEFMAALGLHPSGGKVYIAGFSQGGHAALALQRRLETPGTSACGLGPAANAVIAGACDPYLLLRSWTIKPNRLSGAVAGRIIASYGRVYSMDRAGDESPFKPPYTAMMKDIADNGFTVDKITMLPASPGALFSDKFLAAVSDPGDGYAKVLISNEVYREWRPAAPVNFYHGGADNIVPPIFSKIACRRMKMNGADARFIPAGESLDHAGSIIPSCAAAADWFNIIF